MKVTGKSFLTEGVTFGARRKFGNKKKSDSGDHWPISTTSAIYDIDIPDSAADQLPPRATINGTSHYPISY